VRSAALALVPLDNPVALAAANLANAQAALAAFEGLQWVQSLPPEEFATGPVESAAPGLPDLTGSGLFWSDGLDHRLDLASTDTTIAMMAALAATEPTEERSQREAGLPRIDVPGYQGIGSMAAMARELTIQGILDADPKTDTGRLLAKVKSKANRRKLAEVLYVLRSTLAFRLGPDACHQFQASVRNQILRMGKSYYQNSEFEIKWAEWRILNDPKWREHDGLMVEFADGGVAYLDNGALGGKDRIAWPGEVARRMNWQPARDVHSRPLEEDHVVRITWPLIWENVRRRASEIFWPF